MSLRVLAVVSGVPARTIRFYIAKSLLPGPLRVGRGAAYGNGHLTRLRQIAEWKEQGYALSEISRLLQGESPDADMPTPTRWARYRLAEDVVVDVRDGASPWRARTIQNLLKEMRQRLHDTEEDAKDETT